MLTSSVPCRMMVVPSVDTWRFVHRTDVLTTVVVMPTACDCMMHRTPEKQVQQQCYGGGETTECGHGFSEGERLTILSVVPVTKARSKKSSRLVFGQKLETHGDVSWGLLFRHLSQPSKVTNNPSISAAAWRASAAASKTLKRVLNNVR